jgi:glycolate oxidase iron-sulfur subunit
MQTRLSTEFEGSADGVAAEAILRKCVHCGFCTATCPTYQLLGNELDGPRGRIYLIKQVLEGAEVTRSTQQHLDRCLTCRNCESTCPSGVQYGNLVDIGRRVVDAKVTRPPLERVQRWLLREGLTSPLFEPAMKLGQQLRPLLPKVLRSKVPAARRSSRATHAPLGRHPDRVLLLAGCVQPAMMPDINRATARVLDAAGIETVLAERAGCCGAIRAHLSDWDGALDDMRRNIDAWWPAVAGDGVLAIVTNASGCGVMVKEYAHHLRDDPVYAARAATIAALAVDLSELLPRIAVAIKGRVRAASGKLSFHSPCTLQHGQRLSGGIEAALQEFGFRLAAPPEDATLCCGSAGTYSVLHGRLANQLRDHKLERLQADRPDVIVSANIGCIQHLQSGSAVPVRHWIEVLDEALA